MKRIVSLCLVGGLLTTCASAQESAGRPAPDAALVAGASQAVNRLGFQLWRQQPADANIFFSPYSIHQALGMLYLGTADQTRDQIGTLLGATGDDAVDAAAVTALDQSLSAPATEAGAPFTLTAANGVFGQVGHPFRPEYLSSVVTTYPGSEVRDLDYKTDPSGARAAINEWIADRTAKTIPQLIPDGVITDLTRLVLANAVYFKASWLTPFIDGATQDAPFTKLDGSQVDVPMMRVIGSFRHLKAPGYEAVALPYVGGKVSAVIVLPDEGQMAAVENALDVGSLDEGWSQAGPARVQLSLPRFSFAPALPLRANLLALGMADAFDPDLANLSKIDGTRDLYVSDALHKAFVKVDEAGTEASAATAMVVATRTAMEPPAVMTVDRPFLFLIRDDASGTLLFMGRVVDPAAE